jgi:hypothetical protein
MDLGRSALLGPLVRWASRLRFPILLGITLALFFVNLAVPDAIPLVDEAVMALTALVLARVRKPAEEPSPAEPEGGAPR